MEKSRPGQQLCQYDVQTAGLSLKWVGGGWEVERLGRNCQGNARDYALIKREIDKLLRME